MAASHPIIIHDERSLAAAVLEATRVAQSAGLSRVAVQQLATVTSELGRNILKYAVRGRIQLEAIERKGRKGVRVVASDKGPGIQEVERAMADHYSTGGTLGLGLSGTKRMMDEFTVMSEPGKGTRVEVVKWQ
ncbi:MAG: ATP-binding protein [Betaproteobacteria bacterium]|nr:MAG: ATP-binding protein [Betaproteobacteria bacterium]